LQELVGRLSESWRLAGEFLHQTLTAAPERIGAFSEWLRAGNRGALMVCMLLLLITHRFMRKKK